jgi:hypothetical protein
MEIVEKNVFEAGLDSQHFLVKFFGKMASQLYI